MPEYGILVDFTRCIGCRACEVACKEVNNTPEGIDWIRNIRIGPEYDANGRAYSSNGLFELYALWQSTLYRGLSSQGHLEEAGWYSPYRCDKMYRM